MKVVTEEKVRTQTGTLRYPKEHHRMMRARAALQGKSWNEGMQTIVEMLLTGKLCFINSEGKIFMMQPDGSTPCHVGEFDRKLAAHSVSDNENAALNLQSRNLLR